MTRNSEKSAVEMSLYTGDDNVGGIIEVSCKVKKYQKQENKRYGTINEFLLLAYGIDFQLYSRTPA